MMSGLNDNEDYKFNIADTERSAISLPKSTSPVTPSQNSTTFTKPPLLLHEWALYQYISGRLMQRSEKPIICTSLAVGSIVVGVIPRPLELRLNLTLTLYPSPAMLSMVHDYNLATGTNHEGRKP